MRYRIISGLVVSMILMILLLVASGCATTQLRVERLPTVPTKSDASSPTAPSGLVYFLPYLEVDLEYQRQITQCDPNLAVWLHAELQNLETIRDRLQRVTGQPLPEAGLKNVLGEAFDAVASSLRQLGLSDTKALTLRQENVDAILWDLIQVLLGDELEEYRHLLPTGFAARLREGGETKELLNDLIAKANPASTEARYRLEFSHKVTAKPRYLPDHDHGYWVDYPALTNGFKKTNLTIETHENGAIKSINAAIEDQTGSVITSTFTGVLRLASAIGGVPVVPAAGAQGDVPRAPTMFTPLCRADIYRKIEQRRRLQAEIDPTVKEILGLEGQVKSLNTEIEAVRKQLDTAKATKAKLEADGIGATDPRWQEAKAKIDKIEEDKEKMEKGIAKASKGIRELEATIASRRRQIAALDQDLVQSTVLTFRPTATHRQEEVSGGDKASDRWFEPKGRELYCTGTDNPCTSRSASGVPHKLRAWSAVYLAPGMSNYGATHTQVVTGDNFVYREPAVGRLLVCKAEACLACFQVAARQENRLLEDKIEVPQLGVLATLPLLNQNFQNNNLTATFSESGHLTKLVYDSNARFEAAAETFAASAENLGNFLEARRDAEKAALDRDTAKIQAERDRLKAQFELEQARRCLEALQRGETVDGCDEAAGDGS